MGFIIIYTVQTHVHMGSSERKTACYGPQVMRAMLNTVVQCYSNCGTSLQVIGYQVVE